MIPPEQNQAFESFIAKVKDNGILDPVTTTLIFVGAALAVRCRPCMERFMAQAREQGIGEEQIGAAQAIAMAVRAGSARALVQELDGVEP